MSKANQAVNQANQSLTNQSENISILEKIPSWLKLFITVIFIGIIYLYSSTLGAGKINQFYIIIAAVVGAYMAVNIGANDVANNVGPAVGSGALTLVGAIFIAIIFESLGALTAGGDVVDTIKKGIIDPSMIKNSIEFVWLMMAALIAGGIWLNAATMLGAPVSTTHSIVGGVLGAGIAAGGWGIVNWAVMAKIASSWVISPVLGGVIAAGLLYFIKHNIFYKDDRIKAAQRIIPLLIALMTWAFTSYLLIKGIKKIVKLNFGIIILIALGVAVAAFFVVKPIIIKSTQGKEGNKGLINDLFTIPLIFSAAILSFAHGANDVANAVGPLAAINDAIVNSGISAKADIPLWVMLVGAIGISVGLALYGPKLIKTVGSGITDINKTRAFCVALSASITVIIASQLGLPISSTHVAVGAIFGVGFLREVLVKSYNKTLDEVKQHHENDSSNEKVNKFLEKFDNATPEAKTSLLKQLKNSSKELITNKERKLLKRAYKEQLVTRSVFVRIIAAWFITVPCSALLSALFFFALKGFFIN